MSTGHQFSYLKLFLSEAEHFYFSFITTDPIRYHHTHTQNQPPIGYMFSCVYDRTEG